MTNERLEKVHQLHIELPNDLYNDIKTIFPEKGLVTGLIRGFLRQYVVMHKHQKEGPQLSGFEAMTEQLVKRDIERGR